jgi:hypothetical protein
MALVRFFKHLADKGMRDVVTNATLDTLLGQQAQRPAIVTVGSVGASQSGDFGALGSVNLAGTARTRGVVEAVWPSGDVLVTQGGDGVVVEVEGGGHLGQTFASVELKQCGRALELSNLQRPSRKQGCECGAVLIGEC